MSVHDYDSLSDELVAITRTMVAGFRTSSARELGIDDAKIAAFIKEAVQESFGDGLMCEMKDWGNGPEVTPTMAGTYRMSLIKFGIDPKDQFEQERWFAVVEKALVEALAR